MDLSSLLSEALTAQGYEVDDAPPLEGRSGATYPVSLIAEQGGDRFLVDVLGTRAVTPSDVEALDAIVSDTGLDGALLFALEGVENVDATTAPVERIEIWDRSAIEQALGALVLNQTLKAEDALEDIGPSPTDAETVPAPEESVEQPASAGPTPSPEANGSPPAATGAEPDPAEAAPDDGDAELLTADETPNAPDPDLDTSPDPEATPTGPDRQDPTPQPAQADSGPSQPQTPGTGQDDPAGASDGPDEFLSPEEMAQRAKEMMEKGELPDDGDAEIITDDDPAPTDSPQPSSTQPDARDADTSQQPTDQPPAASSPSQPTEPPADASAPTTDQPASAGPQDDPAAGVDPEPEAEGQVFEEADCELLPSEPKAKRAEDEPEQAPADEPAQATPPGEPADDEASQEPTPPEPQAPEPTASPASAAPSAASGPATLAGPTGDAEGSSFLSGGCLRPRLDEHDARNEAEGALFQVAEARLELLPFYVFEYRAVLEGGETTRETEGRVWVSAQSGAVVTDPDGTLVDEPGIPHERFKGEMTPTNAVAHAREQLLDALETRDELREDYSETAIIERVTLTPREDSLDLVHLGTAFAPRWRVEGQNGTVFVDAITGDLIAG